MSDDTSPPAAHPQRRTAAGSIAPYVPFLTPADGVDLGPAGSLVQARARQRQLRRAERGARARSGQVLLAGLGAGLLLLGAGIWAGRAALGRFSVILFALSALVLLAVAAAAWRRYRPSPGERDLSQVIACERRSARALDSLAAAGWTVLHDRLVPGTEHRLAHVLAGPAGIVVVTEVPLTGPPSMRAGVLHAGNVPLGEWFTTRWWESDHVNAALSDRLTSWPWTGPVYPVALVPNDHRTGLPFRLRPRRTADPAAPTFPLSYSRVAIRSTNQIRAWVGSLPAPLGRLTAATLASEVQTMCPPAAVRDLNLPTR